MTELKTLKDFEFHKEAKELGCCQECGYLQKDNDLREETIKYIKEFDKNPMILPEELIKELAVYPTSTHRIKGAKIILKYIFNITAEDLK